MNVDQYLGSKGKVNDYESVRALEVTAQALVLTQSQWWHPAHIGWKVDVLGSR